jgi:hypothetical protein
MTGIPRLIVRHSRVVATMNGTMGLAVVLGALWYVRANVGDSETPWIGALMVAGLLGVHVWQCLQRFLDPTPVVAVVVPLLFGSMFGDVGQGAGREATELGTRATPRQSCPRPPRTWQCSHRPRPGRG